jgi:hypothetical protein
MESGATVADIYNSLTIPLGVDEPILHKKVANADYSSEPSKDPSRNFRRRRRVNVYADVWGKGVWFRVPKYRVDRVDNNTWPSGEN